MSNLVSEAVIRLMKAVLVGLLALVLYALLTGPLGEPGSIPLALLCWLSAAAFWLLIETSPL
ncbi:MAG: hypothetical protein M3452_11810 [Chloroflexota bacterium]|nr:hypothetical protein [Chloroflexota bacterium]